jgi:hypothetical protein
MSITPTTPQRVALGKDDRWVACSAREFGPVGEVRHVVAVGQATTACGATASTPSIWRGNSTKPACAPCVVAMTKGPQQR